jgi:hypothetical protein
LIFSGIVVILGSLSEVAMLVVGVMEVVVVMFVVGDVADVTA